MNTLEEALVENEFTVERAMQMSSVEALLALALDNGIILPMETARELYIALHGTTGALSDEALDAVFGGNAIAPKMCPECHAKKIGIAWRNNVLYYECSSIHCAHIWKLSE